MAFFAHRVPRPATTRTPHPWFSAGDVVTVARGAPEPYEWWQRRIPSPVQAHPQPLPMWMHSRSYSRGAQAYSPKFGTVFTNPIGNGVASWARHPTISGPGARYQAGTIFFRVQSTPTSVRFNPSIPIETVNALLSTDSNGGGYYTTG